MSESELLDETSDPNIPTYLKSTICSRLRREEKLKSKKEKKEEQDQEKSIYDHTEHKITVPKVPNLKLNRRYDSKVSLNMNESK